MPVREVSTARTLADVSAETITIMATIVRRHEDLEAEHLSNLARRAIGDEIANMKAHLFDLEGRCRRGEIRA